MKVLGSVLLILIAIVLACYIGIPSRLISKGIDSETQANIKSVNQILIKAQSKIPRDSIEGFTPMIPDDYGFIRSTEQVDKLFRFLSTTDRDQIKSLFEEGNVKEICMNHPGCIRYAIKTSLLNYLINSSWETLYLVYNNKPDCNCQDWRSDGDLKPTEEGLGTGWFKVDIVTIRTPIHC